MNEHVPQPSKSSISASLPKRQIRVWKWIVGSGFGIAIVLFALKLVSSTDTGRRSTCKSHLKQIAHAILEYHTQYNRYPPAYTVNENGERLHSWRSLILPFLGQKAVYNQIRWDEPWNSPHNLPLSRTQLGVYCCPNSKQTTRLTTNYFAIVHPATVWPEQYSITAEDVRDGMSNTVFLIEANLDDVNWMEPRDLSRDQAIEQMNGGASALAHDMDGKLGSHIAMCDGTVRFLHHGFNRTFLLSLLSISAGARYPGVSWPDEGDSIEPEFPPPQSPSRLRQTEISPVTNCEIKAGQNIVYCCSFQLAWDQARNSVGGASIQLEGNPKLAVQLNAESFSPGDLSKDCYVSKAGPGNSVIPLIRQELKQRFPNFQSSLPENSDRRAFIAYAYLYRNLPFDVYFDRMNMPLLFASSRVASFGIDKVNLNDSRHTQLLSQVQVVDYVSDDEFVVRLLPRGGKSEILLAKVPPSPSLSATIDAVRARCSKPVGKKVMRDLQGDESLIVPLLSLNVEKDFDELLDREILTSGLSDLYFSAAKQLVRFRLDENGAKIESESFGIGDNGHESPPPPPKPRKLIIDKPFLIWLREPQATAPYFAAWIENTELMTVF